MTDEELFCPKCHASSEAPDQIAIVIDAGGMHYSCLCGHDWTPEYAPEAKPMADALLDAIQKNLGLK